MSACFIYLFTHTGGGERTKEKRQKCHLEREGARCIFEVTEGQIRMRGFFTVVTSPVFLDGRFRIQKKKRIATRKVSIKLFCPAFSTIAAKIAEIKGTYYFFHIKSALYIELY